METYARVGRSKLKHLFAEEHRDEDGNVLPHEFLGGDETRCGRQASGAWGEEEAMGLDWCDHCFRARDLGSRQRHHVQTRKADGAGKAPRW